MENLSSTAKRKLKIACLVAGGLALILFLTLRSHEPVYQGKALSEWLEALDHSLPSYNNESSGKAEEAIRQMGAGAVPRLEAMLQTKDSAWRQFFVANPTLLKRLGLKGPLKLDNFHWRAARGVELIGPPAKATIDELVAIFNTANSRARVRALMALDEVGLEDAEMLRLLRKALHDPNDDLVNTACIILAERKSHVPLVVPELTALLQSPHAQTRELALAVLIMTQTTNSYLKPFVLKQLGGKNANSRMGGAFLLSKLDIAAVDKQTELTKLLTDRDAAVRREATNQLSEINGKLAEEKTIEAKGRRADVLLPDALDYYRKIIGKKVEVRADLSTLRNLAIGILEGVPNEVAAKMLETTLKEEAELIFHHLEDGSVLIRNSRQPAP